MSGAYYNEIDPYAAQWLRNLIKAGLIPPGDVDERSIVDVTPGELMGYTQCHFFAGIGGWAYALRLAGWGDDRAVWTGSCPCQSFSSAGKGKGGADERHLWPFWFHLIRECRPPIIFGEQVASKLALSWLDLVFDDLEATGYACGSADLPACSVGAPHIRQRLWFVANSGRGFFKQRSTWQGVGKVKRPSSSEFVGHAAKFGSGAGLCDSGQGKERGIQLTDPSPTGIVADSGSQGLSKQRGRRQQSEGLAQDSFWSNCVWLPCRDGKWRATGVVADSELSGEGWRRISEHGEDISQDEKQTQQRPIRCGAHSKGKSGPTQSIIQPLAHGIPKRVPKLRAVGNSIVPQVAAEFIKAAMGV